MGSLFYFVVGSYTDGTPYFSDADGEGITLCSLDYETGEVKVVSIFSEILNPSYLAKSDDGTLFAVSECLTGEGQVCAFDIKDEQFILRWTASSRGVATCHVGVVPGGVAATSYLDGKLTLLGHSGRFLDLITYTGSGPVAGRQESSHPHQSVVSPGGQWLLVPDLGADCIWVHHIRQNRIEHQPSAKSVLPSGTGPRHLLFHRRSDRISLLGELDGSLHMGDWDERIGAIQWLFCEDSVLDTTVDGAHASAIRQHPRYSTLFTANRSRHEIVSFSVDEKGKPTWAGLLPAGGGVPRDFAISPDGNWLVAACQASHCLAVHRLNPVTGMPTAALPIIHPLPSPTSILFL